MCFSLSRRLSLAQLVAVCSSFEVPDLPKRESAMEATENEHLTWQERFRKFTDCHSTATRFAVVSSLQ